MKRFGPVLAAVSVLMGTVAIANSPATAASSVSVVASQDAKISESRADSNYGEDSELRVRDGGKDWRSLVQFDVTGLSGPAQVSLRLAVTDGSDKGGDIYSVPPDWSETTVSWANAPQPAGSPVAQIGAVSVGQAVEVAVGTVPGNGRYAFMIAGGSNDSAIYASRESSTPPMLIVIPEPAPTTTTDETTTTTAAPDETTTTTAAPDETTTTITALSVADSHVRSNQPDANLGSSSELRSYSRESTLNDSFMRFSVTGSGTVESAMLRLFVTDANPAGGTVFQVGDTTWSESELTWNNRPAVTGSALASLGAVSAGTWVEVDVTSVVGSSGEFAFSVQGASSDLAVFSSKEGSNAPELVVTVLSSASTTTTTTEAPTTTTTTEAPTTTTSAGDGVWVDADLLASRPMSGAAWNSLKERADGSLGTAHIGDQNSKHDINTLAVALVAARTGDLSYRAKAEQALLDVIGTDENPDPNCDYTPSKARAMSLGRNLLSYVVAADVLGFRDPAFVAWVDMVRFKDNCPNTGSGSYPDGKWLDLSEEHNSSGSNGSGMAGASRIAAAAYVGDTAEVERGWATFRRFAGDRSVGPNLSFNSNGLTWSHDANNPVAVNPAGSTKDGQRIDGAIINDIGRGGAFTWPPGYTQYQWEGAAGFFAQAQLLAQAGYPAWDVQDQAPRRVVEFSLHLANLFGSTWWDHSDWVKYLANHAYGLQLPISEPADDGKNMAWTDWVFGP